MFGARIGLSRLAERVYAAAAVLAAGGWLAVAALLGPFTAPMPQVLGIGALVLAVPWWAHRRRRARVRVQRALAAWPDIAKAIGLPGSKIQSASVDLWGWRARVRLARGQTIADVTARIPAIESALGTYRGAVRVYPTGDGKANRCELRVLDTDPHAEAIAWPGPVRPVDHRTRGPRPVRGRRAVPRVVPAPARAVRRHDRVGQERRAERPHGHPGRLRRRGHLGHRPQEGHGTRPWAPCIDRLATTPEEAAALLADAVAILQARAAHLAATGRRVWEPSPDMPALVIIIDEYAELADEAPDAMSDTDSIARLGRAVAVTLVAATQRPTQKAMGQGAVRSQMDTRICFRVRERKDVDLVLGQGMLNAGWHAHTLNAPGKFLVSAPEHTTPKRARAYLVTDDDVARIVARYAAAPAALDEVSRGALDLGPAAAEPVQWYLTTHGDPGDAQSDPDEPGDAPDGYDTTTPEGALWLALCTAPDDGADIAELMRLSGMTRPTLYRHLAAHADAGPRDPGQPRPLARDHHRGRAMRVCLTQLVSSHASRVSARKGAHADDETNSETSYPQALV